MFQAGSHQHLVLRNGQTVCPFYCKKEEKPSFQLVEEEKKEPLGGWECIKTFADEINCINRLKPSGNVSEIPQPILQYYSICVVSFVHSTKNMRHLLISQALGREIQWRMRQLWFLPSPCLQRHQEDAEHIRINFYTSAQKHTHI